MFALTNNGFLHYCLLKNNLLYYIHIVIKQIVEFKIQLLYNCMLML